MISDRQRRALNEHLFVGPLREVVVQYLLGTSRLADAIVVLRNVSGPDGAADQHRRDDEREPAEDRRSAVLRAPAPGARRQVTPLHRACLPFVDLSNGEEARNAGRK